MNTKTKLYNDVTVGDKLPSLEVPVSTSLVVGSAAASRDYTAVHHDKKAAQAAGMPDVFMNILASNGFAGRFATDWAGPDSTLKGIDIRLGAPNIPGFILTLSGEVTAKDDVNNIVDITIMGENNVWGMHMMGTVRIALPTKTQG